MSKKFVGINDECKNNVMALALKKAGLKAQKSKCAWPKLKGPVGIRIDCGTGYMVAAVNNNKEGLTK